MKAETKKEAEKKWKQYFADRFYLSTPEEKITSAALLDAYKSALRAEIEHQMSQLTPSSDVASGKKSGLRKALELMDTVTPEQ